MLIQQSAFTIHGTRTPLETLPDCGKFLVKYEIPAASKSDIEWELRLSGLHRSKLFPDLINLARGVEEQQANSLKRSEEKHK
jgi:hypothetical protein